MSDEEKTKLLWWVIAAFVGSVGVNQGINKATSEVRYDAWTASQDTRAMAEVYRRFVRNEVYIDDLQDDVQVALANDAVCKEGLQSLMKRFDEHLRRHHP